MVRSKIGRRVLEKVPVSISNFKLPNRKDGKNQKPHKTNENKTTKLLAVGKNYS